MGYDSDDSRLLVAIVISLVPSHFFIPSKSQRNCECTNIEQRHTCTVHEIMLTIVIIVASVNIMCNIIARLKDQTAVRACTAKILRHQNMA